MNTKLLIPILLSTAFIAGLSFSAEKAEQSVGRFQLTAGPYLYISDQAALPQTKSGLFLLDTATGDVTELIETLEKGKSTIGYRAFIRMGHER